jgi:mersacidin/lichenicidin family type 2 lantibiotic
MSNAEIIRAWKDPVYRSTLTVVPAHPAGLIELTPRDLGGGAGTPDRGHVTRSTVGRCCFTRGNFKCNPSPPTP